MDAREIQLELPSLDFPGRKVLYPQECADRIGVSVDHLHDLVTEGALGGLDVSGRNNLSDRRTLRIPIEDWLKFLASRRV